MRKRALVLVVLQSFLVLALAGPAAADEVAAAEEGRLPSVSFLDPGPLAVEGSALSEDGALEVEVHNDLGKPQRIFLRVVGPEQSEDEAVRSYFSEPEVSSEGKIGRGGTATLRLPVAAVPSNPETSSVEAQLVAWGQSGGLIRRSLSVSLAEPAAGTPTGNALQPKQAINLTMVAVNFIPSPLSNATAFGLFLVFVLGMGVALLSRQMRRIDRNLPLLLAAVAILAAAVASAFLISSDHWNQPSAHAISPRSVPVAGVAEGTVGAASTESGKLARLVVAGDKLLPEGLGGAGAYKGTYDIDPDTEGSKEVTVNVRDFWLYAVIAITLGLLIAYWLHSWYQKLRPSRETNKRLEEMHYECERRTEAFKNQSRGAPYEGLSLEARLQRVSGEIRRKVDQGDKEGVAKQLADLEVYLNRYYRLWKALRSLDQASAGLMELHENHPQDVKAEDLDAYVAARRLLTSAPLVVGPDQEPETLLEKVKEVEAQDRLVREIRRLLESVLRHLEATRSAGASSQPKKADLETLEQKFITLARRVLQVNKAEEAEKLEVEDDERTIDLLHLVDEIKKVAPGQRLLLNVADEGLFQGLWEVEPRAVEAKFLEVLAKRPQRPARPEADVAWAHWNDKCPGIAEVYRGETIYFTVTVAPSPAPSSTIEVELEPGSKRSVLLTPGPGNWLGHLQYRYTAGGSYTVIVRSTDGEVLGRRTIEVSAQTKVEEEARSLSDYDRTAAVTAFALAVTSGMTVLYLNDPAWGEPIDYLSALVWGGITGAGVKLASAIADRVFPAP